MKAVFVCAIVLLGSAAVSGLPDGEDRYMSEYKPLRKMLAPGDKCITFINECLVTNIDIAIAFSETGTSIRSRGWYRVNPLGGRKQICWRGSPNVAVHFDFQGDGESPSFLGDSDGGVPALVISSHDNCVSGSTKFDVIERVGATLTYEDIIHGTGVWDDCSDLGADYHFAEFYVVPDTETFTLSCS